MHLSIVSGTWNRLEHLKRMIESARSQLPVGIDIEFAIVDGGSTDGTLDYLRGQPNIHLIEHGELRGAIAAFNDGAYAARGEYVILANDDISFADGSIIRALVYLDAHPDCGAVAFADDRLAPGYEVEGYHVQTIRAIDSNGNPVDVIYPQVGMVRKWLGDLVGWWDIGDPRQHTYGGDAALGAKIWQHGYTVDAVENCRIDDHLAPDDLRQRNHEVEQARGSAYYRRYPNGVQIASLSKPANPQRERLRILYLPLYDPSVPHRYKRGLRDALSEVGLVYEHDYLVERSPHILYEAVETFQPHLILTQVHFPDDRLSTEMLRQARGYAPDAVVVNWCGDVYLDKLTAPPMLEFLKYVDLQLVVNADAIPVYQQHGIQSAYWQVAFEPVLGDLPPMPAHDILFLGNAYTQKRLQLGAALHRINPRLEVGIYGYGWEDAKGNTTYDFAKGASLYRNCTLAIGDNQYPDQGFVSNRIFEALASGAFLLHQVVPGLESLTGLKDGVHYAAWGGSGDYTRDLSDLRDKAKWWLAPDNAARRHEIAHSGEAFVREHHSFRARVRELFEVLLPKVMQVRASSQGGVHLAAVEG